MNNLLFFHLTKEKRISNAFYSYFFALRRLFNQQDESKLNNYFLFRFFQPHFDLRRAEIPLKSHFSQTFQ